MSFLRVHVLNIDIIYIWFMSFLRVLVLKIDIIYIEHISIFDYVNNHVFY